MQKHPLSIFTAALELASALACGGGGGSTGSAPAAPLVPGGLSASGSLRNIHLAWTASSGAGLTGYNVYRSTDGTGFTKVNTAVVTGTAYDDAIPSPGGDGVVFQYRITAVGGLESEPSAVVKGVHGSRLPAASAAGFTTTAQGSPYVAEGNVVVNGGHLVVDSGTSLYVLDSAALDLEAVDPGGSKGYVWVKGLLRVLATAANHATFTAHKTGGALENNEGFLFRFEGAVDYNPADGSGTLLQNALITNLASGNVNGGFQFVSGSPRLFNLNVTANASTGGSYLHLWGGAPLIQNSAFSRLVVAVEHDLRGSAFRVDHCRFRGGYYAIYVGPLNGNPGLGPGQIDSCDLDGSKPAALFNVTGVAPVPVGNNFWNGGTGTPPLPAETISGSTVHYDFGSALLTAPPGAGPSWQ